MIFTTLFLAIVSRTMSMPSASGCQQYSVISGDTGYNIASNHGIDFDTRLKVDNPQVSNWDNLQPGDILSICNGGATPAPDPQPAPVTVSGSGSGKPIGDYAPGQKYVSVASCYFDFRNGGTPPGGGNGITQCGQKAGPDAYLSVAENRMKPGENCGRCIKFTRMSDNNSQTLNDISALQLNINDGLEDEGDVSGYSQKHDFDLDFTKFQLGGASSCDGFILVEWTIDPSCDQS